MNHGTTAQIVRFAAIGAISVAVFLLLYNLLRAAVGPQASNLIALAITATASTAANRRFTFGIRGRGHLGRSQIEGLALFAVGLGLSSAALALLAHVDPGAGQTLELLVVVVANAVATVVRFVGFRWWVFNPRRRWT